MKAELDEIDKSILKFLQDNARTPFAEIARQLHIGESTVRFRVKRLLDKGVIVRFMALVNPFKFGLYLTALLLLKIDPQKLREVFNELSSFEDIHYILQCTGEYDAVAKIKDLVSNAKNHLMIALPAFTEPFMFSLLPLFKSLLDTNVKVSIMVPKDRNENMKVLENIGEVRLKDNMFGGGLIADGREAILILGEKKTSLTIWSDHLGLVKFAKDYFQHLWDSAEKAQQ